MGVVIRAGYWVPAIAWMALIFYMSSHKQPTTSNALASAGHFGEYLVLALLYSLALYNSSSLTGWQVPAAAGLLSAVYGATDEMHQLFVPGRHADPLDWLIDVTAAAAGTLAVYLATNQRAQARRR